MNSLGVVEEYCGMRDLNFSTWILIILLSLDFLRYVAGNLLYHDVSKVGSPFTIIGSYVLWTF